MPRLGYRFDDAAVYSADRSSPEAIGVEEEIVSLNRELDLMELTGRGNLDGAEFIFLGKDADIIEDEIDMYERVRQSSFDEWSASDTEGAFIALSKLSYKTTGRIVPLQIDGRQIAENPHQVMDLILQKKASLMQTAKSGGSAFITKAVQAFTNLVKAVQLKWKKHISGYNDTFEEVLKLKASDYNTAKAANSRRYTDALSNFAGMYGVVCGSYKMRFEETVKFPKDDDSTRLMNDDGYEPDEDAFITTMEDDPDYVQDITTMSPEGKNISSNIGKYKKITNASKLEKLINILKYDLQNKKDKDLSPKKLKNLIKQLEAQLRIVNAKQNKQADDGGQKESTSRGMSSVPGSSRTVGEGVGGKRRKDLVVRPGTALVHIPDAVESKKYEKPIDDATAVSMSLIDIMVTQLAGAKSIADIANLLSSDYKESSVNMHMYINSIKDIEKEEKDGASKQRVFYGFSQTTCRCLFVNKSGDWDMRSIVCEKTPYIDIADNTNYATSIVLLKAGASGSKKIFDNFSKVSGNMQKFISQVHKTFRSGDDDNYSNVALAISVARAMYNNLWKAMNDGMEVLEAGLDNLVKN